MAGEGRSLRDAEAPALPLSLPAAIQISACNSLCVASKRLHKQREHDNGEEHEEGEDQQD